jgi:hypothetical protein
MHLDYKFFLYLNQTENAEVVLISLKLPKPHFYDDGITQNEIDAYKILNMTDEMTDHDVPIEVKYSDYYHSDVFLMVR